MMLATPVRRSAWSSTRRTLALPVGVVTVASPTASTNCLDLGGQRRGLPRQHDLRAAARRGDDGQRRADAIGALLHAGQPESRPRPIAWIAAPIVGHRESQ